ncbi:MAG: DUF3598 family protein [Pseudomonadota bacterium]
MKPTLVLAATLLCAVALADRAPWQAEIDATIPVTARHLGVWEGIYRRYDATGAALESFDSRVEMRFDDTGAYRQTNTYSRDGEVTQVIEAAGKLGSDRLFFANDRVEGWAADVAADPERLTSVLFMRFKDDSGIECHELIRLTADGERRHRMTQCVRGGKLLSRTLIDERRVE